MSCENSSLELRKEMGLVMHSISSLCELFLNIDNIWLNFLLFVSEIEIFQDMWVGGDSGQKCDC